MNSQTRAAYIARDIQIWLRHRKGETQKQLAKEFGISTSRVGQICYVVNHRLTRALMSRRWAPYREPYAYGIWFHFEAGVPGANVTLEP